MTDDAFAQLRGLLSSEPDEAAFGQLIAQLNDWYFEGNPMETALAYAEEHLSSWAPEARRLGVRPCWQDFPEGSPLATFSLVRALELRAENLGDEGVCTAAQSPHLSHIVQLDLRSAGLGDEGAKAIAQSPHLSQLTHLALWDNRIGDEGAKALAASPHLAGLQMLDLNSNPIGPEGYRALGMSEHLSAPVREKVLLYKLTTKQLKDLAKLHQIPGRSKMGKEALVGALLEAPFDP